MEICGTIVADFHYSSILVTRISHQWKSVAQMLQNFHHYIAYLGMEKGGVTLSVRRSTSVSQTNGILQHECCRISIIYCILVTTMCHQWKFAARLSQNFHYSSILVYSLFGDGEGRGYTVCTSVKICLSNQWNSAARMSQNYIAYLGMEKGGVTLSVRRLTSVSQTNGILRHECHRISIIHCILVTTMCHQWNSVARMSQNFHHTLYYIAYLGMEKGGVTLSVCQSTSVSQTNGILRHECRSISIIHCILVTTMCHQWNSAARILQNFHYIAYLGMEKGRVTPSVCRSTSVSHTTRNLQQECHRFLIIDQCLSVTPPGICGTFAAK
jgi:hypothetical protein